MKNMKMLNVVEICKWWVCRDNDFYMILNGFNGWEWMIKRYNMRVGS